MWKVRAKEKIKYSPALQAHLSLIVAQSLLNHGNLSVTKCRKVQAGERLCIHNQTYSPTQYKLTGWFHCSTFREAVMSKGVLMIIVEDGKNCAQSLSYQHPAGYYAAGKSPTFQPLFYCWQCRKLKKYIYIFRVFAELKKIVICACKLFLVVK